MISQEDGDHFYVDLLKKVLVNNPNAKIFTKAIDDAIELKPEVCFPVHDGILKSIGSTNRIPP